VPANPRLAKKKIAYAISFASGHITGATPAAI